MQMTKADSLLMEASGAQRNWRPWLLVLASTLALMVGQGTINVFAASVFLKPVAAELGFTRAQVSTAIGVSNLMIALFVPVFGMLMDRYRVRRPLLWSILLFAVATAALSLTPASASVLVLLYALSGIVGVGQNPGAYSKVVSDWFDNRRGLALGITLSGVGLGTAIVPQLSAALVAGVGWRWGYVGLGSLIFLVAFGSVFFLVKDTDTERDVAAATTGAPGMERGEILRSPKFWSMGLAFLVVGLAINGSLVHVVPLLTDSGYSVAAAVNAISMAGIALIAGRLLVGYLMDKIHAAILAVVLLIVPAVGLGILGSGLFGLSPIVGAVLLGLGIGGEIDLMSYLVSRYFGRRNFGFAHGVLFSLTVIGNSIGAAALGWSFERNHGYQFGMTVCAIALLLSCALFAGLGRYRYPPPTSAH